MLNSIPFQTFYRLPDVSSSFRHPALDLFILKQYDELRAGE
jgi:hypothetical protein